MQGWRRFWLPVSLILAGVLLVLLHFTTQIDPPAAPDQVVLSEVTATAVDIVVPPSATPSITPSATPFPTLTPTPSPTRQTQTPTPRPSATASATPTITLTPTPTSTAVPQATAVVPAHQPITYRERFGIAGGMREAGRAQEAGLPFGSYLNWNIHANPARPGGANYWQMVRIRQSGLWVDWETLAQTIAQQPGSIWIVGNEPDVAEQDFVPPERYAELYHEVYTFIKERDPAARVAIGGVAQPTPLRRAYLDRILNEYQTRYGRSMPVDVWTVHAFILREEQNSWGVGIPLGVGGVAGQLYEIDDHVDLEIFRQNIIDFRAWMAERGYRERPLAITEMGILMPADYGFPPEVVIEFMQGSFDFLLTAVNETGYPDDNNRLVQWWFWFTVDGPPEAYATGRLFDRSSGQLTAAGQAYADYVHHRGAQR